MTTLLNDHGRQRTTNFVAKKFEGESAVSQKLKREKAKMEGHAIDNNEDEDGGDKPGKEAGKEASAPSSPFKTPQPKRKGGGRKAGAASQAEKEVSGGGARVAHS